MAERENNLLFPLTIFRNGEVIFTSNPAEANNDDVNVEETMDDSEQIPEHIEEDDEEKLPVIGAIGHLCEICLTIIATKVEFVAHLKTEHPGVVDENVLRSLEANNDDDVNVEEESKSPVEIEPSDNCDDHQTNEILEEIHVNLYSCVISKRCKETFQSDHDLERHVLEDHSNHKLSREDINELLLAKYKAESNRLNTFKGWNYMFISPEKLAQSGFVNTGREDFVQCVFCAGIIGNWEEEDDPMVEHKKEFPKCRFIFNDGYNVGNIPIVEHNPEISISDVEILDNDDAVVVELPNQDHDFVNVEDESKSLMEIEPSDKCDDHQTDEILEVTCGNIFSCVISNCKETFQSDHDLENHVLNDHSNHNHRREDINELLLAKYKAESDRLNTFKGWNYIFNSPEKLAQSGFINTGREDYVQCVFCAGIIGHWEEEDDPMVEHKKEFPKCGFIFNDNVGNITKNVSQSHLKERNFKCEICHKSFGKKGHLKEHINEGHFKVRKHKCDICGRRFARKNVFDQHKNITHQKEEIHSCAICNFAYESRKGLNKHMRIHRGKKKNHKCESCDKEADLIKHIKIHHEKKNNYQCKSSDKVFDKKTDLKKHIIKIDPQKKENYQCEFCDNVFHKKHELEEHIETAHQCEFCNKLFVNDDDLTNHIRTYHQEEIYCHCDYCNDVFGRKKN